MSFAYYPMYPADFDVDEKVRLMEDCELGLFLRCLNHSWKNDGLPSDPEDIRRCFRDDPEQFEIKWKRVQYCFPISEDGRRRNPRQEEERLEAISKSKKAKKSAKSRWSCERNANALLAHCEGNARASDYDSDSKEGSSNTEKASTRASRFDEFWSEYWRKDDKQMAQKRFATHADSDAKAGAIIAAVKAHSAYYLTREPDHRPLAATWLNKRRYEDPVPGSFDPPQVGEKKTRQFNIMEGV